MKARDSGPLRVGLTGGIASGKTTVADLFAAVGAAVVDTDVIAREVVAPGMPALAEIVSAFGADSLDEHGNLDREAMRQRVFSDPAARETLESIVHPKIRAAMWRQIEACPGPYVIVVIPLLVETGQHRNMDRVLVVDVPEPVQLERALARDGSDLATIESIIARQATRESRLEAADDIIENSAGVEHLREHVTRLDSKYRGLASARSLRAARDQ